MSELLPSLNLLTSWTLHILYSISDWQLRILAPPLDFSAPKNCHREGGGGGVTANCYGYCNPLLQGPRNDLVVGN